MADKRIYEDERQTRAYIDGRNARRWDLRIAYYEKLEAGELENRRVNNG